MDIPFSFSQGDALSRFIANGQISDSATNQSANNALPRFNQFGNNTVGMFHSQTWHLQSCLDSIVALNSSPSGFSPQTINVFRRLMSKKKTW